MYTLHPATPDKPEAITCHTCGLTSFNPHDVMERYCGHCHQFHDSDFPADIFEPGDNEVGRAMRRVWHRATPEERQAVLAAFRRGSASSAPEQNLLFEWGGRLAMEMKNAHAKAP